MRPFETVVVVDWSASAAPSPKRPSKDAIWIGVARAEGVETSYHRTRAAALAWLEAVLRAEVEAGRRTLAGFDFPFGWPRGFAERVAGGPSALAVWDRLATLIEDGPDNASNRWDVAASLNALFPGTGPFWGCPAHEARAGLSPTKAGWGGHGLPERRHAERRVPRAQPGWKLAYTGSVGSQALLGQARLAAFRRRVPCAVWPFETWDEAPVVLAEIYPSILGDAVPREGIRDEAQVRALSRALLRVLRDGRFLDAPAQAAPEEGWILGLGFEAELRAAAAADPAVLGAGPPRAGAPPGPAPSPDLASAAGGAEARVSDAGPSDRATRTRSADRRAEIQPPDARSPGAAGGAPAASPPPEPEPPDAASRGPAAAPVGDAPPLVAAAPHASTSRAQAHPTDAGLRPTDDHGAFSPPLVSPPLSNDCFALPPGVDWTPVDAALARLREGLSPVTGPEAVPLAEAAGRVLAEGAVARRSSPPGANAAVDGYGFAHAASAPGGNVMPLVPGRAAAGAPLGRPVPEGGAARILTGALLPEGVDTVILQEDAAVAGGRVAFAGPVRPGANTRAAGEDVAAGATALPAGRRLSPPDLALLASLGIAEVSVRARLRVGVLSTGDEIAEPDETDDPSRTYDANRPMLMACLARWDHEAVDLGHVPDDRARLRERLDRAGCDAVLTSGGASAGEEDHVSAILAAEGHVTTWRVAMKPGRPLAMGLWRGAPVLGLPGNPVAAFVCALVFARPALSVLAGSGWVEPQGFELPAAFAKRKKAGRRELLRARVRQGRAEVFGSEGSGRVSGLSWAEGLVELGEEAREVRPGDRVRFVPYGSFGL